MHPRKVYLAVKLLTPNISCYTCTSWWMDKAFSLKIIRAKYPLEAKRIVPRVLVAISDSSVMSFRK